MTRTLRTLALAPLACLFLSGCHVTEHKNGVADNVDIGTPFGSMHVKTDDSGNAATIGFDTYPGAVPVKDDDDKDGSSANVSMSFGGFHLGVKAASFQTSDPQDKVLAFYRKDLAARYGGVIECQEHKTIGSQVRTAQGLTCETNVQTPHIHTNDGHSKGLAIMSGNSFNDLELRAGSEQHQHIVGVESRNGGTKISLVALDLPSHLSDHDSNDRE